MKASSRGVRRAIAGLVLASGAILTLSCSDALRTPTELRSGDAASNASLLGSLLGSLHLLSCTPLPYDSVTQTIGASGGTITVGPHTFVVPAGALTQSVSITAVAPSVPRREVHFEPEGLTFDKPASLTLSYAQCSLVSQLVPKKVVYVNDNLNVLELVQSLDNILARKVTGSIGHFSAYAVAY